MAEGSNLTRAGMRRGPVMLAIMAVAFAAWLWRRGATPPLGEIAWWCAFLATTLIRIPHAKKAAAIPTRASHVDRQEAWLMLLVTVGMMLLPFLQLATPLLDVFTIALPRAATFAGIALLVPGLCLFWRSHADLARNWSPTLELRQGHRLVDTGIYAHIRHPMYAAIWLIVIAQPLLLHNLVAGLGAPLAFAAMYALRVPREEAMMDRHFGELYAAYARRTGRIWPRFMR
ncbi:protein-S-isoprenylcysteine O-methyltransferase [Dokdonella sp. MW10]|uniref:protein-S-isoprenylcysteine O-methyltransferase n=1 Tax=Dokdonella sp. MW10 TaxID=2992926 RepID=UPI003F7DCF7E